MTSYSTCHHERMKSYLVDLRTKLAESMSRGFDSRALPKPKASHSDKQTMTSNSGRADERTRTAYPCSLLFDLSAYIRFNSLPTAPYSHPNIKPRARHVGRPFVLPQAVQSLRHTSCGLRG